MPVKGADLSEMTFMIRDNEGREWILPGKLETAEIEEESYGDEFRDALRGNSEGLEISTTIRIHARNWRGMFDQIIGNQTKAAFRFKRSVKRQKEKRRREKLKGGI